jgi:hypothetical protein
MLRGDPFQDYLADPFNEFGLAPEWNPPQTARITELGPVAVNQLADLIRQNDGHFDAAASDSLVQYARSRWWQFSVQLSRDGATARITETSYVLYGGVALGAVLLLATLTRR